MGGWRIWIQGAESMKAQIEEILRFVPLEGLKCGVGFDKIRGTRKGMGLMKSKFIGRNAEMSQLAELWGKRASSLVVCRGRRRIGKSTLIEEFAARSNCRFIEISGLPPDSKMTNQRQLDSFCERLSMQIGCSKVKADSWQGAFAHLSKAVGQRTKTVVLLDEISWMGKYDPAFPGELKNLWDLSLARRDNLVFFVCGSVSAWIQRNILNNTGFVGRISLEFVLDEMRLDDSVGFWGRMSKHLSCGEFFDVLSVTGAVPRYLEEINPRLSADENVRRMCFTSGGYLFRDFDRIFNDVFGESHAIKREIMLSLRSGPKTVSEIAQIVERAKNGHVSEHLVELEKAGFVASDAGVNPETGGKALALRYRIKDNYSRFYLRYVEPHREAIQKGVYAAPPLAELPEWDTVMGLQFENLMLNHLSEFYERLGLDRARVLSIAPYRRAASVRNGPGVQIDLLIQTPKTYFVVEVKRKRRIGVEIEKEVEEKVSRLRVRKGVSVRTALVYQGELDPQVKEDGYFSALIDAETLLRHLRVPQV